MAHLDLPVGYPRIKTVASFAELLQTPLVAGVNALCWPRLLDGDFGEVVHQLGRHEEILRLDEEQLRHLRLSNRGRQAVDFMLQDLRLLQTQQLSPELNCIEQYPRDEDPAVMPVDVYSFHADSAPVPAETWLCTYHGAPSEGLRNDEALRRIDVPATRAELLHCYGGIDDEGFREFLQENCYDLHYAPAPHARPFSFGLGNLWRIAVDYPGSPVPPCIHRAPAPEAGGQRLLLIS